MLAHEFFEIVRRLRVQSRHGFVQDPHLRLVYERADDVELLLHAVGIRLYLLADRVAEREEVEILVQPLFAQSGRHVEHVADEVDELHPRQPLVQDVVVRNIADELLCRDGIVAQIHSAHTHRSALEADYAGHALYRGGFSRAVRTYEAVYLPFFDVEGKVVHGRSRVSRISLCELMYVQHRNRIPYRAY